MSEITRLLDAAGRGDGQAAADLLPLVYTELRRLAAQRLTRENPGQTLEATALVHEAYLRLVQSPNPDVTGNDPQWNGRGHFFAAAAEAMRRILIDQARRKQAEIHGGGLLRVEMPEEIAGADRPEHLLALDDALTTLEQHDESAARLVKLRYFAGLSHQEAAEALGINRGAADRLWALARAWLFRQLSK